MGRKRSSEPNTDPHGRVTLVNLKGPTVDRDYLDRVSRKSGVPLSTIVRRGIALWVAKHGHEQAPADWIEDPPESAPVTEAPAKNPRARRSDG